MVSSCCSLALFVALAAAPPAPLKVALASSLSAPMQELAAAFQARTGRAVTLSPGSSGLLARQIEEGAPFDVFVSADERSVDQLVAAGAALAETRVRYARGTLVVWWPASSPGVRTLTDLSGAAVRRVALANPEHAPYGRAAREALRAAGLWDRVAPKAVYAGTVQQAQVFAETGNAEVALVARSLAQGRGRFLPVDQRLYPPQEQAAVVCSRSAQREAAAAFLALLTGKEGQALLARHGLSAPGTAGGSGSTSGGTP